MQTMAENNHTDGDPQEENGEEVSDAIEIDLETETNVDNSYSKLNDELDKISHYLDALEQKNDTLNEELHKLLQENRQIRSELQKQNNS